MKIGVIRCQQTEDICPGDTDFAFARNGKGAFEDTGPAEIVGFVSCGGCPGKRAIGRAKLMVSRGAEAIAVASCISRGNPIGFACANLDAILDGIRRKLGPDIPIVEWTH
jgi:predicted metal-binding protein